MKNPLTEDMFLVLNKRIEKILTAAPFVLGIINC